MTNKQVTIMYAEGIKDNGHSASRTIFFEDKTIFSYGYHFPIAYKVNESIALFNSDNYSVTTQKHQSLVRSALEEFNYFLIEVPTQAINDYQVKALEKETRKEINKYFDTVITNAQEKLKRARVTGMVEYWKDTIKSYEEQKVVFNSL